MRKKVPTIFLVGVIVTALAALTPGCISYHKDPGFNQMLENFEGGVD